MVMNTLPCFFVMAEAKYLWNVHDLPVHTRECGPGTVVNKTNVCVRRSSYTRSIHQMSAEGLKRIVCSLVPISDHERGVPDRGRQADP